VKPSVTRALPNHLAGGTCLLIFAAGLIRLEAAEVAPVPNDAPKPEIIGEGAISTPDDEFGGSLSPDGTTIYFDVTVPPHYLYALCESHLVNGQWQKPEVLPFSGSYRDSDPVLTPDGNTMLFASDRPRNGMESHSFYIWSVRRTAKGWADLHALDGPVNSEGSQVFASWPTMAIFISLQTGTRGGSESFVHGWWMENIRMRKTLAPSSTRMEFIAWKLLFLRTKVIC
jgi:hypothetical protein